MSTILFCILAFSAARSSEWPAVEREFLRTHPTCEACGRKPPEVQMVAHHVVSFAKAPERELDPKNLIALCDDNRKGADRKACCHWQVGHGNKSWQYANPDARKDAAARLRRVQRHPDKKD